MYNAVGIDVSKGKSTVAVLQPGGVIVKKPFDVAHSISGLKELTDYITRKYSVDCGLIDGKQDLYPFIIGAE